MAIPEGHVQMNLYIPDEMLRAVDQAAYEATGRKNARSDWIRDAIADKLGRERDARMTAIEAAFDSMNEDGRNALAEYSSMARGYKPFKA